MIKRVGILTVGMVILLCATTFSLAYAATTLQINNVYMNSSSQVTGTLSWSQPVVSVGPIYWQGNTFPAMEFNASTVYLYETSPTGVLKNLGKVSGSSKTITKPSAGYRYKLLCVGYHPINGKYCSSYSNEVTLALLPPSTPTLITPGRYGFVSMKSAFTLNWTATTNTYIYEAHQDNNPSFSTPNHPQYWPRTNYDSSVRVHVPERQYFRVRAWNALPEKGGTASAWSNVVQVDVSDGTLGPTINQPGTIYENTGFWLTWSKVSTAKMYQVYMDTTSSFSSSNLKQFWPSSNSEPIPAQAAGTYYFKVRGWTAAPEKGGNATYWSQTLTLTVQQKIPVIDHANDPVPPAVVYPATFTVDWSDVPGTKIYEVNMIEYGAGSGTKREFWPSGSVETITPLKPGIFNITVRAWSDLPENGGVATAWSKPLQLHFRPAKPYLSTETRDMLSDETITCQWGDNNPSGSVSYCLGIRRSSETTDYAKYDPVNSPYVLAALTPDDYALSLKAYVKYSDGTQTASDTSDAAALRVITDEMFMDSIEKRAFDYLMETTYENGLTRDRYHADRAGVNYPLNDETDVVSIAATGFYLSALSIGTERGWITRDEAFLRARTTLTTLSQVQNYYGFFYHFMAPDGSPVVFPSDEVSSMDTAIALAGALQAGEYFGGEVKDLAEALYQRVDWGKMFNWYTYLFHMAWQEGKGLSGEYGAHSEALLLYILGIGSPTHPVPEYSFYNFARVRGSYGGGETFITTFGGQLFIFQFPHAWVNFNGLKDGLGTNWWDNSRAAVLANRRYCMDHAEKGYSEYVWGLSACDGPYGYKAYGSLPAQWQEDDGTIAPYAIAASMPFEPETVKASLKQLYKGWNDIAWNSYGFVDGFNPAMQWGGDYYLALDQGAALLMMENAQSGIVWNTFMQSPHVQLALQRLRFEGFANGYQFIENFEDGNYWTPETSLGWWDSDGSTVYKRYPEYVMSHGGREAMRIEYNKNGLEWSCIGAYIAANNPLRDFSGKSKLYFWLCGNAEVLVKLRDRSFHECDVQRVKGVSSGTWTYCELDLGNVSGLTMSDIDNIIFFVEPGKAQGVGTILIDDIGIE